ncbi:17792_t:CDS:1, partial [Racocetra fulgida]
AIATLIQTQQGLTDALNVGGNANANANIAQLVPNNNNNIPKISIRIPNYKGKLQENVVAWLLQIQSIFCIQGINGDDTQIHYAATG